MILHTSSVAKQVATVNDQESVLKPALSTTLHQLPSKQDAANGDDLGAQAKTSAIASDLASQMQASATKASQLLKSLSHPDRLLLLCQLTQGEYCVGELESLVGVGQPSLSQQLGILRKDKLVTTRREGKQIYYSIASDDALAVLQLLYERFCETKGAAIDS